MAQVANFSSLIFVTSALEMSSDRNYSVVFYQSQVSLREFSSEHTTPQIFLFYLWKKFFKWSKTSITNHQKDLSCDMLLCLIFPLFCRIRMPSERSRIYILACWKASNFRSWKNLCLSLFWGYQERFMASRISCFVLQVPVAVIMYNNSSSLKVFIAKGFPMKCCTHERNDILWKGCVA